MVNTLTVVDAYTSQVIGTFTRDTSNHIDFRYQQGTAQTEQLSMSLPLNGRHTGQAPANWLRNLLPPNELLQSYYSFHGVSNPFDLLSLIGHDVSGRYSLISEHSLPYLPQLRVPLDLLSTVQELLTTGIKLGNKYDRVSIGGYQGKFTYWRDGNGVPFKPTYVLPSQYIMKVPGLPGDILREYKALQLAQSLGLPTSEHELYQVPDTDLYTLEVKRWDRVGYRRVHAEDLCQALGMSESSKYNLPICRALAVLRKNNVDTTEFLKQVIFKALIGDSDAHMKNYSFLYTPDGIKTAPLYDTMSTKGWNVSQDIPGFGVPADKIDWEEFALDYELPWVPPYVQQLKGCINVQELVIVAQATK